MDYRDILMSLLVYTAWISPKICGHARLIAAPHSRRRFPDWLQRFPHRLENNRCRRAVQHGETASGSTMKEPWPKPVDDSQKARSQHRYSKMKVLFATLAVSITVHSVKLVKPQLTFDELVKPLVSNALCWARGTVRPVSQWSSTNIKTRNTMDHLLWVRQVRRVTCSMTQAHPICGCPTPIVTMVLKSQFLPRMQIKHLRRQRQHIQDRVRLGSSVRFLLQGHCERWGCVNRRLHFRRND